MKKQETITINVLGNSQREQWHTIVNLIRQGAFRMTQEGLNGLCDELDRYIDYAENIIDELRKEG